VLPNVTSSGTTDEPIYNTEGIAYGKPRKGGSKKRTGPALYIKTIHHSLDPRVPEKQKPVFGLKKVEREMGLPVLASEWSDAK